MNQDNESKRNPERKLNIKADILIGLSIIIILLLLMFRGCEAIGPSGSPAPPTGNMIADTGVMEGDIPDLTDEERLELMQRQTDDAVFTVQALSAGSLEAGSRYLDLTVANPQNNTHACRFDLLINGETLYTSPVLQPHTYIQAMELSRALEPGAYTAVVRYSILSDSGEVTGNTEVEVKILCS